MVSKKFLDTIHVVMILARNHDYSTVQLLLRHDVINGMPRGAACVLAAASLCPPARRAAEPALRQRHKSAFCEGLQELATEEATAEELATETPRHKKTHYTCRGRKEKGRGRTGAHSTGHITLAEAGNREVGHRGHISSTMEVESMDPGAIDMGSADALSDVHELVGFLTSPQPKVCHRGPVSGTPA